jgi:hypothetical protein
LKFRAAIAYLLISSFAFWQLNVNHTHEHHEKHHKHLELNTHHSGGDSVSEHCDACDFLLTTANSPDVFSTAIYNIGPLKTPTAGVFRPVFVPPSLDLNKSPPQDYL